MWARNGRWILPEMPDFRVAFRNLLHAVNLRHGTDGFTSPPKEGVLRIFSPWKIRRLRPGLKPRTWVPKASTLPLDHRSSLTGHLEVSKKKNRIIAEKATYIHTYIIGLFILSCNIQIWNNSIYITNILLTWRVQFMEIGCQGVRKWKKSGNRWSRVSKINLFVKSSLISNLGRQSVAC